MLKEFVEAKLKQFPAGLSRGLDNEDKAIAFREFRQSLNGTECLMSPKVLNLVLVDHHEEFFTDTHLYVYSQPYGGSWYGPLEPRALPDWELVEAIDTSWYYPERCYTALYRRPLSDLIGYQSRSAAWVIWVTAVEELSARDRKFKDVKLFEGVKKC